MAIRFSPSRFTLSSRRCQREAVGGNHEAASDDYFILKPKYSGFFATPLDLLLDHLNVNTIILTGIAGDMCVQFTANDAYMRNYQLLIPSDCVASNSTEKNERALHTMKEVLKANTSASSQIELH
ncbi:cysteine hydrolase family protein [Halalkalibacter akibai]|uniref:cysteine hydrolase family protein n=1 Tax=Halalkalibacter akibai TaxID=1411 RepID=UPI0034E2C041